MPGSALVLFFEWVSLLGAGLTALKLFRSGLYRRYRFFLLYLVSLVPYGICLLVLDVNSGLVPEILYGHRAACSGSSISW